MTKDQLIQYLRVCADLADAPKDGVAHVAIVPLRQAIQLLESSAEPTGDRLRDCETSLRAFDPGATSEYWLRHEPSTPPPIDNDHVAEGCEKFGEHHD